MLYRYYYEARIIRVDVVKALSVFVETSLSRRHYEAIREEDFKDRSPYYSILQKKKVCYWAQNYCRITETCLEVDLQT